MASEVVESLFAALLDMSAVTGIIGTGDDAALYDWLKEDVKVPVTGLIVVENDSLTDPSTDLSGRGGLDYYDINILVRGPKQSVVAALARAIRQNGTDPGTGLEGYSAAPIDTLIKAHLTGTVGPTHATREDGSANPDWDINLSFTVSQQEVA
jgi:hypothetical protein